MSPENKDNPIYLWKHTAHEARDAFLSELAKKATEWRVNNIPKTRDLLVEALKSESPINTEKGDVQTQTWKKILGFIKINDKYDQDQLIVSYNNVEIWYFSNTVEWQQQLVSFLLELYEFASNGERAEVIKAVDQQILQMGIALDLVELKKTFANYRFCSNDVQAIKDGTQDVKKETRTTKKENKAQQGNNEAMEDFTIKRIQSAVLALRETELAGVKSLIDDYIRNYTLLKESFQKETINRKDFLDKIGTEKQELILALGSLLNSLEYSQSDSRELKKVLESLGITMRQIRNAKKTQAKDIKEWYRNTIQLWDPVWAVDRSRTHDSWGNGVDGRSQGRRTNTWSSTAWSRMNQSWSRESSRQSSSVVPQSQQVDNKYSSGSGNGYAQDVRINVSDGVVTYIDNNGNRVTKVEYVKLSTDNLLQNYLEIAPGVLNNPQSQLGALQEAKQLALALTHRIVENPADVQRIKNTLWGDANMIDMIQRALGWSIEEQQKLHAAYQRQLTQIRVQSMQLRGPDYATHNFLLGDAEKERALTDAFFSVFIDKYSESMRPFLHGRNPVTNLVADKSIYTREQLVALFLPMQRDSFYWFVKETFAPEVNLDDASVPMNWTNGVATPWWVIDQAVQKWMESLLASGSPGLAKAVGVAGNLLKVSYKFVKTWALVYWWWKLLKWSFGFVSTLLSANGTFTTAWAAFTAEFWGAMKALGVHLWMWFLDKDRAWISGYVNNVVNEWYDSFLGDGAESVPRSTSETREWGRELLGSVLWSRTLKELSDLRILYSEWGDLKINLDNLSDDEKKTLIPSWFRWQQKSNLTMNLTKTISSELGIDAWLWRDLVSSQENVKFQDLLNTYYTRAGDIANLEAAIGTLLDTKLYHRLRFLSPAEYAEQYKKYAFIAQQQQKLRFGPEYVDFAKSGLLAWVDVDKVKNRMNLSDKYRRTVSDYLQAKLQAYAKDGNSNHLNAYFSALAIAFSDSEECVSAVVNPTSTDTSTDTPPDTIETLRWDYNVSKGNNPLYFFFHNPEIGNKVNNTTLVNGPLIGHDSSSASTLNHSYIQAKQDVVTIMSSAEYSTHLTNNTWEEMCE
jgi:hypothetical protein